MTRYVRKSQEVRAIKATPDNLDEVREFLGGSNLVRVNPIRLPGTWSETHDGVEILFGGRTIRQPLPCWVIQTLGGWIQVYTVKQFNSLYEEKV